MMDYFSLVTIIIIPLLLGAARIVLPWMRTRRTPLNLATISLLGVIAGSMSNLFRDTSQIFCMAWLADAGSMCIGFDKSGLLVTFLLGFCLILLLYTHTDQTILMPGQLLGLMIMSLGAGNTALSTEHFLMRYAALEVVGLCLVGATLITADSEGNSWRNTRLVFLNLKIGDMGLLAAILLMHTESASFNISPSMNQALTLPALARLMLVFSLLIATWVKLAVWPLNRWVIACHSHYPAVRAWFAHMLLPTLGVYLLYRSTPLLQSEGIDANIIAAAVCIAALIQGNRIFSPKNHSIRNANLHLFSSTCLVLLAAVSDQYFFWAYMILWVMGSLILIVFPEKIKKTAGKAAKAIVFINWSSRLLFLLILSVALWNVSLSQAIQPFFLFIMWAVWWMHCIQTLQYISALHPVIDSRPKTSFTKEGLMFFLGGLGITIVSLPGFLSIAELAALYVKQQSIHLIPDNFDIQIHPFFSVSFWAALPLAVLLNIFHNRNQSYAVQSKTWLDDILSQEKSELIGKSGNPPKDPLDVTNPVSSFLIKIAQFLYQYVERSSIEKLAKVFQRIFTFLFEKVERGSIEKLAKVFQRVFTFLFEKVEKFTSADMWVGILNSVLQSSRKIQSVHSGLLRVNLLWLLLFIAFLILVVMSFNLGSLMSIV